MPNYNQAHRPSVLFRPRLWFHDGDGLIVDPWGNTGLHVSIPCWCAQYDQGSHAVMGTGYTPDEAMRDFDKRWVAK